MIHCYCDMFPYYHDSVHYRLALVFTCVCMLTVSFNFVLHRYLQYWDLQEYMVTKSVIVYSQAAHHCVLIPQLLYTLGVHFVGSNVTAVINVSQCTAVDRETLTNFRVKLSN